MSARVIPLRAPPAGPTAGEPPELREAPNFDEVFRSYAPYVAAVALRLLGRDSEVDDLVQDTFVAALKGLHTLHDPSGIKHWLAKIAVHEALRRLRRRRVAQWVGLDRTATDLAAIGATPEQRALLREVFRVLDRLPAKDRIAWSLRYLQGEPIERVATLCDCSLATAKRRIAAAQIAVEEALGDG